MFKPTNNLKTLKFNLYANYISDTMSQLSRRVPDSVYNLLVWTLKEDKEYDPHVSRAPCEANVHKCAVNIGQEFVRLVTNILTPKHVGLAISIHNLTRSKALIRIAYGFGVCISYDSLRRILTTIGMEMQGKMDKDEVDIPPNITPGIFVQRAMDNLDFLEESRSGKTTHATSSVLYERLPNNEVDLAQTDSTQQELALRQDRQLKPTNTVTILQCYASYIESKLFFRCAVSLIELFGKHCEAIFWSSKRN